MPRRRRALRRGGGSRSPPSPQYGKPHFLKTSCNKLGAHVGHIPVSVTVMARPLFITQLQPRSWELHWQVTSYWSLTVPAAPHCTLSYTVQLFDEPFDATLCEPHTTLPLVPLVEVPLAPLVPVVPLVPVDPPSLPEAPLVPEVPLVPLLPPSVPETPPSPF